MASRDTHVAEGAIRGAIRRDGMHENRRLRIASRGQLRLRSLPAQPGEREAKHVIGFLERAARDVARTGEVATHPHELRALAGEEQTYHRITPEPQVKPAPNATIITISPGLMRPCSSASSSATGSVAE